jgi:hypothetical protein
VGAENQQPKTEKIIQVSNLERSAMLETGGALKLDATKLSWPIYTVNAMILYERFRDNDHVARVFTGDRRCQSRLRRPMGRSR